VLKVDGVVLRHQVIPQIEALPLLLVYIIYFCLILLPLFYHTILVSELILALDRHRDITNNNSTANKVSIKSFKDISETLDSLAKTQFVV